MSVVSNSKNRIYPFYQKLTDLCSKEKQLYRKKIKRLLTERDAIIIAHYYTDSEIQQLTEEVGGCVADSLEMARFGAKHSASTLLVAGVRFMGETAKILSPEKTILMPNLNAECSLDLDCPQDKFYEFCDAHPERTVVVYANTAAVIKARADWVVTSSIAIELIDYLDSLGQKIIWAPDKHLGNYIKKKTGADMLCWQGTCVVHNEFKIQALRKMKKLYPKAAILAHPESPQAIVDIADSVGSTSQLIKAAKSLPNKQLIVATDRGIFFKMQQIVPEKELIEAPTAGEGATCQSCAHCPWMAMNDLKSIARGLEISDSDNHEIFINHEICKRALTPLNRMLNFAAHIHT